MAKYAHEEYYDVPTLQERGWPLESIIPLLGHGDKLVPNRRVPTARPIRYYSIERVQAAERLTAWRAWRDKEVERRVQHYQAKHRA